MLNNVLGWPIENRAIAMQAVGLSKCLGMYNVWKKKHRKILIKTSFKKGFGHISLKSVFMQIKVTRM